MTGRDGRGLRQVVLAIVLAGFVLPILSGFGLSLATAFGILPGGTPGLLAWRGLFDLPGIGRSIELSVATGFAATILSLGLSAVVLPVIWARIGPRGRSWLLSPFLAAPHAAMAIGLAFLIAPSGWLFRLVSPWATGWTVPPDIATVEDPFGLAVVLGLVVKEVPFLLLVMLAALARLPVAETERTGRSLGYGGPVIWACLILPQVYGLVRLPVYVVLSFSLSVVDMAMILGPSTPAPLAVVMTRAFLSPDLADAPTASAAAVLMVGLVALSIALWWMGEWLCAVALRRLVRSARPRGGAALAVVSRVAGSLAFILLVLGWLALLAVVVWSFAFRWPFPDVLPSDWSLAAWGRGVASWSGTAATTALIGAATTALSLLLAILWLEGEDRGGYDRARWAEGLIYLPLGFPQIAFLPGLYVWMLSAGVRPGPVAVIWAQTLFVFPYVMLSLSDPWRALDRRHLRVAAALGAGPWRRLFRVRLPMLAGPLWTAAAVGFSVSVALYLPTLFAGAGRVATLTTEAVSLSSGSDRRVAAVYATLQLLLPLAAYGAAFVVPHLMARNRRGMAGGSAA